MQLEFFEHRQAGVTKIGQNLLPNTTVALRGRHSLLQCQMPQGYLHQNCAHQVQKSSCLIYCILHTYSMIS